MRMFVVLAGCAALGGVAAKAYADPVGSSAADPSFIAASAYCPQHLGQQVTEARPPTPTPQPLPIIDLPIITPGAA